MAKELVETIRQNKGKVLIRALVKEILYDEKTNRVIGVLMNDKVGTIIKCRQAVVSSVGYYNTYNSLFINQKMKEKYQILNTLPVKQSSSFVMCNIGINAPASEIGVTNTNTWHIPVDENNDAFPIIKAYFKDPMAVMSLKGTE